MRAIWLAVIRPPKGPLQIINAGYNTLSTLLATGDIVGPRRYRYISVGEAHGLGIPSDEIERWKAKAKEEECQEKAV